MYNAFREAPNLDQLYSDIETGLKMPAEKAGSCFTEWLYLDMMFNKQLLELSYLTKPENTKKGLLESTGMSKMITLNQVQLKQPQQKTVEE